MGRKNKGGRPTKMTPAVTKKIIEGLRKGLYRKDAARWAGITYRTMRTWLKKGEQQKSGKHKEFLHAVIQAEEDTVFLCTKSVLEAARGRPGFIRVLDDGTKAIAKERPPEWKAAAWFLSRKRPAEWGERKQITVDGESTVNVTSRTATAIERLPLALRKKLLEAIREQEAEDEAKQTVPANGGGGNGRLPGNGKSRL